MKIVLKKEDEKSISAISDKLNAIASIKMVEDEKKGKKKQKEIPLIRPGTADGNLLKKNVNLFIMMTVIILICGGVGIAVLYMNVIKDVSSEKDSLKGNFTSCRTSLENYMGVLSLTEKELNSTSEDIKKYDTLYEEKTAALETTQNELQKTSADLVSTKTLLASTVENLKKTTADLATMTTQRASLQAQVDKLTKEKLALELLVDNLQEDLEDCK